MPELPVTDEQLRRLEAVREDLEAAYVGPYGTVRPEDALEYLLDTYSPPSDGAAPDPADPADEGAAVGGTTDADGDGGDTADDRDGGESSGAAGSQPSGDGNPEETLQQAMSLLDAHEERWRESSGDEPYEVDLPDGSTEAVRTKDDVKRLLFKHWK